MTMRHRQGMAALLALVCLLLPTLAHAANGDLVEMTSQTRDFKATWTLLDAQTGTDSGTWIDYRGFTNGNLEVSGIAAATVQLRCSNTTTKPTNATDATQWGADITANGLTTVPGPCRWVKAKLSANGGATAITAKLTAATQGGGGGGTGSTVTVSNTVAKITLGTAVSGTLADVGVVAAVPHTFDGADYTAVPPSPTYHVSTAAVNAVNVKASAGVLYGMNVTNTNAAVRYIAFYNKASAPTCNTDTIVWQIAIPGETTGAGFALPLPGGGLNFTTGISYCLATSYDGTGAVGANELLVSGSYK